MARIAMVRRWGRELACDSGMKAPRVEFRLVLCTDAVPCGFDRRTFRLCAPRVRRHPPGSRHGCSQGGRSGAAAGPRRRPRVDRGRARAGRDRRCGDREGEGAAGCRPGGDIRRALDARRPASTARAAHASERAAQPGACREGGLSGPGAGCSRRRGQGKRGRREASACLLPRPGFVRAGAGQGDRRRRFELGAGGARAASAEVEATAVAEAAAPPNAAGGAMPATASGGGYSGPLVYRTGEGMRPDVAAAFDRMAAAAPARRPVALVVNSGFRSDAEQAALFAAHPDPQWVAPPGHSLHRCATELDLGPESAYGWLAANASPLRLRPALLLGGLALRLRAGPAPCSAAGQLGRRRRRRRRRAASRGRPGCPPSSPPGSGRRCCAPRPAGTSRRPCSRRS